MEIYCIGTLLSLIIIFITHFTPSLRARKTGESEGFETKREIPKGWEDYYAAVKNSLPQKTPSKLALRIEPYLYKISEIIGVLIVNLIVFMILFLLNSTTFFQFIFFSFVNSIWIPFLVLPVFEKFSQLVRKKNKLSKNKLSPEYNTEILLSNNLKEDWKIYEDFLNIYNIERLYHFTDRLNLESIKNQGGLFSWHYCLINNIQIEKAGGNELSRTLDRSKNLENYVRVSFVDKHPMLYTALTDGRIKDPVILEIDPKVIFLRTSKCCTTNATKSGAKIGDSFDIFSSIRVDLFNKSYFDLNDDEKSLFQAEILVLEKIPLIYILNINQHK